MNKCMNYSQSNKGKCVKNMKLITHKVNVWEVIGRLPAVEVVEHDDRVQQVRTVRQSAQGDDPRPRQERVHVAWNNTTVTGITVTVIYRVYNTQIT